MKKVILNEEIRKKLPALNQPIAFCDETGQTLGHFIPGQIPEPILPKEELERRLTEPRYSTEEVIRYLESL